MTIMGINGSPRKNWNTATLLTKALEGTASQGADIELVHLYDLAYKECTSCFACKIIDGPHNGRCALKDDLSPILKKIEEEADAVILGTLIYFGTMTGEMRSCLERLRARLPDRCKGMNLASMPCRTDASIGRKKRSVLYDIAALFSEV